MNALAPFAEKLVGTEPRTLRSLIDDAWQAQQALNAIYAPQAPLPRESVVIAAEDRFYRARHALCDWFLFSEGVPTSELDHLRAVL